MRPSQCTTHISDDFPALSALFLNGWRKLKYTTPNYKTTLAQSMSQVYIVPLLWYVSRMVLKIYYFNSAILTIGKKLPSFPLWVRGLNYQPQRREASLLPLRHHGPFKQLLSIKIIIKRTKQIVKYFVFRKSLFPISHCF